MSIPKRLSLYKASRHQRNFAEDIKNGLYSDKMWTQICQPKDKRYPYFRRKYQQKFVQDVHIEFLEDGDGVVTEI